LSQAVKEFSKIGNS